MDKYYIYKHIRESDNIIFYIGKGQNNRAYSKNRSDWWKRTVKKHGYRIEFIAEDLTESEAFQLEIELIATHGRRDLGTGTLVNMTDGGEGPSGCKRSDEFKKGVSDYWKGKTPSLSTKKKMSESKKGNRNCPTLEVINIFTGTLYNSITDAALDIHMNVKTLHRQLSGVSKNKTNLRII